LRPEKRYAADEIGRIMDGTFSFILTSFKGLDSTRMDLLRRTVREKSGRYLVIKNSIFGIAGRERGLEELCGLVEGQVGVVLGQDDSIELLKAVVRFGKENRELRILGGLFEGEVRSGERMLAIAGMPPRQVAAGEVVGALGAPVSEMVQVLSEALRGMVLVLGSRGEMKESPVSRKGGGAG
jgi:large subunit ribosomal protein L10